MSVVLPEASGPKISTIRPRGRPPTPSARSSDSAPVGIASTLTWKASSPIFMIEPSPNSRWICVIALFSAASRALAAFSCSLSHVVLPEVLVGQQTDRSGIGRFGGVHDA